MKISIDYEYIQQKINFFKLLNGSIVFAWMIFVVWILAQFAKAVF